METLINIITFIFAVLQIVLFFKIWGMVNDIRDIKEKYLNSKYILTRSEFLQRQAERQAEMIEGGYKFAKGSLVVIKENEDQFRIGNVEKIDDVFYYSSSNPYRPKKYAEDEIELFDVYFGIGRHE